MKKALKETSAKDIESAVEEFAKYSGLLDLFAWQEFCRNDSDDDAVQFVIKLELLFDATWAVLTRANLKTDQASKALTKTLKKAIQKYVSDNNRFRPNLLPRLLTDAPMKELQKLAATRIFRAHLDSYMRSGLMYIYYFEVLLYAVFTSIFMSLSVRFKFAENTSEVWDNVRTRDMTIACFVLAIYFLLREIAQLYAMLKLNVGSNWYKDPWNYIDLIASGGTIILLEYFFSVGPGPEYEHFASAITMFVWVKVLGFAKAFSQPVATFVLMLSKIFQDLFSFLFVLIIIIVMFGHAFFLVLATKEKNEELEELDFTTISGTALSLYLMILGTFESAAFTGVWSQGLFLSYSFLVVIVLLNVLIAIVGDSYDAVLVTSTELFWRSRLELIAEITTTFDWILRTNWSDPHMWKDMLKNVEEKVIALLTCIFVSGNDHPLIYGLRIILSPLLGLFGVAVFFSLVVPWFFIEGTVDKFIENHIAPVSDSNLELEMEKTSSSDIWTGRVLDIVRRVNKKTSAEFVKLESKMEDREKKMTAEIHALKDENDDLKKLLSDEMKSNKKETKLLKSMLTALVKKAGAEVEHDEDDDEDDDKDVEEEETTPGTQQKEGKSEDPDSPPPPPPPPAASSNIESDPNTVQNPMIQEPGLELSTLK
ncbi:hypothetical protein TrVE_jg5806 [Triparma verrucosa]|uniref:Ion transport domain-containing protein n=1 Tax=Triparma verrucosa TaxID=1606542 RepID=A0A9W7KRP6_9STRA|nr:hypothetical protein TrVE_jg5806 [Triparma verrucosa]